MPDFEKLAQMIKDIRSVEMRELCQALVAGLERSTDTQSSFLTISSIRNIVGDNVPIEKMLFALNILSSDGFGLLKRSFIFSDGAHEFELDDAEIEEAKLCGGLPHPETGELVEDYPSYVYPIFSLNSDGAKAA